MKKHRLSLPVQLAVCEQLSQLLATGFSLRESLQVIGLIFTPHAQLWAALDQWLSDGSALAAGLEKAHFQSQIVSQLKLAERHGQLAAALMDAARLVRVQTESRRRLRQLMMYPLVLIALLAVIQIILIIGVLPMLGGGQSQFVQRELIGLVVAAGTIVLFWGVIKRWDAVHRARFYQRLPLVNRLAVNYYQYQFVSGLAQYLAAGLPLAAYFDTLAALANDPLAPVGRAVQARLASGVQIPEAMKHPLIFAPARELLLLGQPAELVQAGMALFATQLLAQFEARVERWLAVVQPLMFLVIGLQIVLMYREMLLPLYDNLGGFP